MTDDQANLCPCCGKKPYVAKKKGGTGTACRSRYYREYVTCKCGMMTKQYKRPGQAVAVWNNRSAS